MCRSIKPLFNFEPPATPEEIRAAAVQFVRKVSGFREPSKANTTAFDTAVDDIATTTADLVGSLVTAAPTRDRDAEASRARARAAKRYAGA